MATQKVISGRTRTLQVQPISVQSPTDRLILQLQSVIDGHEANGRDAHDLSVLILMMHNGDDKFRQTFEDIYSVFRLNDGEYGMILNQPHTERPHRTCKLLEAYSEEQGTHAIVTHGSYARDADFAIGVYKRAMLRRSMRLHTIFKCARGITF